MRRLVVVLLVGCCLTPRAGAEGDAAGREFFESKIRPVLVEHCYACHSQEAATKKKLRGGLLLDTRDGFLKGGDGGPVVVDGKPDASRLFTALSHNDDLKMPPRGKLADAVVADFKAWIERGAILTDDTKPVRVAETIDWDKARRYWAFRPPVTASPPAVRDAAWVRRPLDAFVLAELEKRGLRPVAPAAKRDLLRRATFDLVGLPPTPEEMERARNDESADWYEKVVDRLLASPHHGERWGRYWLDVARYAEDKALAMAKASPHAWRYRDWVVDALNRDMPYDRFVRLQLAGDLLPDDGDKAERLAGLGFQGLGAEYHRGNFAAQVMADELDDRIDTLSRGLLGLTVACARCHDHKYDPIPTRDYYALGAAYQGSTLAELPLSEPAVVEKYRAWEKAVKDLEAAVKKAPDRKAELEKLKAAAPPAPDMVHGVQGGGQAMRIHVRGNVEKLGDDAPPGFLRILRRGEPGKTFTRLDLADAIATADNPLTARVIVNRVWHHHFGRGLVGTPSNFGELGDRPTHPDLLDTLAVGFVANGWSLKWLHREILLSATYRLGSATDADNLARDADNRYLWRMSPRRLDVEAWRDALLAVSGRLDPSVGGVSLDPASPKNTRRTIYSRVSRSVPNATLTLFDFPDANVTSDRRSTTTVPQQQLFVLNSDFMAETAKAFAARLEQSAQDEASRIDLAFRLAYGRSPTEAERELGQAFLQSVEPGRDKLTPWEQYAQALLATNEFQWVD